MRLTDMVPSLGFFFFVPDLANRVVVVKGEGGGAVRKANDVEQVSHDSSRDAARMDRFIFDFMN